MLQRPGQLDDINWRRAQAQEIYQELLLTESSWKRLYQSVNWVYLPEYLSSTISDDADLACAYTSASVKSAFNRG